MGLLYAEDAAHGYILLREKLSKAMKPGSYGNCAARLLYSCSEVPGPCP